MLGLLSVACAAVPTAAPTAAEVGVVYARGAALDAGKHPALLLSTRRRLSPGLYTLTLAQVDTHHHRHTVRQTITVR
jgi:hypothetical protein